MKALNNISLIAPCGMNCGLCMAYLREKDKCSGCRAADTEKRASCVRCSVVCCEVFRDGKKKFCYQCDRFPCARIRQLDKRYRTKYHMSMIENLENIKKSGIRKFVKSEKARWTCAGCGGTICVHRPKCLTCGKAYY